MRHGAPIKLGFLVFLLARQKAPQLRCVSDITTYTYKPYEYFSTSGNLAQIYFMTHGFADSGDNFWLKELQARLIKRPGVRAYRCGWSVGAAMESLPYTQAPANVFANGFDLAGERRSHRFHYRVSLLTCPWHPYTVRPAYPAFSGNAARSGRKPQGKHHVHWPLAWWPLVRFRRQDPLPGCHHSSCGCQAQARQNHRLRPRWAGL